MANKKRPRQITFRVSDEEYEILKAKIAKSGKNQQQFLIECVLDGKVYNTDGIQNFSPELKRIGNNLNQVARALNENRYYGGYYDSRISDAVIENQEECERLWQLLSQYLQRQR